MTIPTDPIEAAAFHVTFISGGGRPEIYITGLRDPLLCSSQAGEGVCFLLNSVQGVGGKMYFFPNFASVWPDGEKAPRPQIPTEMIVDMVPGYAEALRGLLTLVPRGTDRIARVTH